MDDNPLDILCRELNQPLDVVMGFVSSLKIFTDKGVSIQQALEACIKTNTEIINKSVKISESKEVKEMAVNWFYE